MTTLPATIQEQIPLPTERGEGGGSGAGLSAGDFAAILKHRLVMIIGLWLLFSAIGVGAFFLVYFEFPSYKAEAFIECISDLPTRPGEYADKAMTEDRHNRFIASHALFAVSPTVLESVLQSQEVRSTSWYAEADKAERRLELEDALRSGPVKDTNYFKVSMACRDPMDPAKIVNQVVTTYMEKVRSKAAEAYRRELAGYQSEHSALQTQIGQKLRQIQDFVGTLEPGVVDAEKGQTPIVKEILALQTQVTNLDLQTLELESFVKIYTDPGGPGVTVEDRQQVEADPNVISLDNQINLLEQEMEAMLRDLGPEHREVKTLRQRLEAIEKQAAEVRENTLREILEFRTELVLSSFATSQHQLLLIQDRLAQAKAMQSDQERKLAEHDKLKDELMMLKETTVRFDEYIREVERVVREQTAVKIDVAQPAVNPLERSSPRLLLLPACVVLALALAIGIAVGLELLDTSVRTPQDMVRHLSLPLLGTVPDTDDEEVDIEEVETAVRAAPHSMLAEAFRIIRTNLQFSAPAERQRTVLITSPRPEDGKTAVSCNLAASMALAGRRVLLVDANLRRPGIRRVFTSVNAVGLSNFLIGAAGFDELICKTDMANLDVVGSGPLPPNPAELFNDRLAGEFLKEASGRYDQVIIDTAPVLLASDATVLATRVDGVILVCRAKDNSRGQALRALSLLDRVNASVFGGILNCAQVRRGGYFREQLRTFYEYQEEEGAAATGRILPSDTTKAIAATAKGRKKDGDADSGEPA